jgi:DNA invertase Pin-like site-specific DNA recombinase
VLVGYARCSTDDQELAAQRARLDELGVGEDRIYTDQGSPGRNRDRPGLREALAAARAGDTLVVAKLDRLAQSVPDARDIADDLAAKGVKLSRNGSGYDRVDPVGKLLFTTLSMVAEFEADLIAAGTREGMAIAKAKGRLEGKKPKLGPVKEKHLVQLHADSTHTVAELCELFDVTRSTVYRAIDRERVQVPTGVSVQSIILDMSLGSVRTPRVQFQRSKLNSTAEYCSIPSGSPEHRQRSRERR